MTKPPHPLHPVSLRMTFEEKANLEKAAAGMSLAAYIRWRLFAPDMPPPRTRGNFPVKDHKALAQLLAMLGQSRLANNVNQLARAANTGSLPVTPETEEALLMAVREVSNMRALLIQALDVARLARASDAKLKSIRILANRNSFVYFTRMLSREIFPLLVKRLGQFDSVALLGPRQVGKTTLARQIADTAGDSAKYLDLERPADRRLLDDPDAYFAAHAQHLIVLDEIQRAPEIFRVLRGQIDQRRRMGGAGGKFLILGSASMDLLRQSSESLAGRISYLELGPLNAREVELKNGGSLDRLWLQGGFPPSYVRDDGEESLQWRRDFIQTYLERDLPQFGFNVDSEQIDRFWRMLANDQGELFNAERYARSLGVSGHTVTRYLDMLEKLLLIRVLRPWSVNSGKRLVKSPRPFVRDSGLLHALLDLRNIDDIRRHSVAGKSWEGFVIENLVGASLGRAKPYFYRSSGGAEADLVLEFAPGKCWAIEIKLSSAPTIDRGFHNAADDLGAERRLLVYKGSERFPMRGGVEAMPLTVAMDEISSAVQA